MAKFKWERWPLRDLLELRLCDLKVELEGSWVEDAIERLYAELEERQVRFRPHFWLSDEWFSPAGVPGVAIPFYLAHPRLIALERAQMNEVDGGTLTSCMKILRHESGHALQHAYELHRRRAWQQVFGHSTTPYPDWYLPNPASKRFVHNLDAWYAQSHPDEDFAETFAVWLEPRSRWRKRYAGWPALQKLEYVSGLMAEIGGKRPRVTRRTKIDPVAGIKRTLREYYAEKRDRYAVGFSHAYDRDLVQLFSQPSKPASGEPASTFLRRHRRDVSDRVARWTHSDPFTVDQVLKDIIGRCRELKLRAVRPGRALLGDFALLLAAQTMRRLYRRKVWHSL